MKQLQTQAFVDTESGGSEIGEMMLGYLPGFLNME